MISRRGLLGAVAGLFVTRKLPATEMVTETITKPWRGNVVMPEELLKDNVIDIRSYVSRRYHEEIREFVDRQMVQGDRATKSPPLFHVRTS